MTSKLQSRLESGEIRQKANRNDRSHRVWIVLLAGVGRGNWRHRPCWQRWTCGLSLRGIYETPAISNKPEIEGSRQNVAQILQSVLSAPRTLLTEAESKEVLCLYGIPVVHTRIARSEDEAVEWALKIGFPVALKLHSQTITHKTDVGGVELNLQDQAAVHEAYRAIQNSVAASAGPEHFLGVTVQPMVHLNGYELILGSTVDPQFGPVILFGSGGQLVEIYRDRGLALPPLNTTLAKRLMEQTRIFQAFCGTRGRAAIDVDALAQVLVRFSDLVIEQPRIKEIDVNPLMMSPAQILALDARILLHPPALAEEVLLRSVIRPYPRQYISSWKTKDGIDVVIRPIRAEDEPSMVSFHKGLSEQTVYMRYFNMQNLSARAAHERLVRHCFIDYDREMALVVDRETVGGVDREIIAVGRMIKSRSAQEAEVAVLVSDAYQHRGLGNELLHRLISIARDEGLREIVANILPENAAMRALANHFGFTIRNTGDPRMLTAVLYL